MIHADTPQTTRMDKEHSMKTIIVGLGNPILGDDGVGWRVADEVKAQLRPDDGMDVVCLSLGGLGLMEHLIGFDRAIIVDAFIAEKDDIGSILIRSLKDMPNYSAFHTTSGHDTSLLDAIELGRSMGAHLPDDVAVIGIAIQRISEFGENLSPQVEDCVSQAAHIVLNLLDKN